MKTASPRNRKVQLAFGAAMAVLLVVGALSYRGLAISNESNRLVRHTHEALENLQDLLFAMESIESSLRGFVLTGKASYLDAYHASKTKLRKDQATLAALTIDNPQQQGRLAELDQLAARRIERADLIIGLRRTKGVGSVIDAMRSEIGQRITDEFQQVVRNMQDEELRLLVLRDAAANEHLAQTRMVLVLGTALGLLIAGAAGLGIQRDSAGRRRTEAALQESEEKYRMLLEAAPDAMVVVNPAGEIVLLNVQAEKQFGYRRDELVGRQVTGIIPQGFAERLVADGLRFVEDAPAQQIDAGIELTARRKDGSEFPIELMLSPLRSTEGVLVTAAIRDISLRKEAQVHLAQKVEELNRSNEELGQFAYLASHDLQEPLRMVASYTQLLARRYKGKLDADADEFIAHAVNGATRMQRLIQDLLAYSRVGSKGRELLATSSEEALAQALLNLRGAIDDAEAVVTHDPLPCVLADEMQLTQLFQNLVANAIKYRNGATPRVHIAAARNDPTQWMFSVKDNGLGIDPQYFEKIFGMFQRLHKREEFAGTGIGLAICKKIVERHGGRIWVESQPGQGSTFRFALADSGGKA